MNCFPDELSGGEQQRVSIARAFVNHPPLLICDEPTGNLDPDTSVGIMQLLYRINRTGTTVVMATHDREMVDKMRRRVIALEDGAVVRDERRGGYGDDARCGPSSSSARRSARSSRTSRPRVAATMTVLIGMFLLGLFIALGSLGGLVDRPREEGGASSRSSSARRSRATTTRAEADQRRQASSSTRCPRSSRSSSSRGRGLGRNEGAVPGADRGLVGNPLPDCLRGDAEDADDSQAIAQRLEPLPAGRREGRLREEEDRSDPQGGDDHRDRSS